MPYIKQERREELDKEYGTPKFLGFLGDTELRRGDIAYLLFRMFLAQEPVFANYADLMGRINQQQKKLDNYRKDGEIECAKMEIYRRIIAKYENSKIRENGDIECDT